MVVPSAFQQLPLSSLLTPGPPSRPSWLPKPDSEALVFSATPALSQNFRLKLGDWMKSGLSTACNGGGGRAGGGAGGGVDAGVTLLTRATNPRPSITILSKYRPLPCG